MLRGDDERRNIFRFSGLLAGEDNVSAHENFPSFIFAQAERRKQSGAWSLSMPAACIQA